MSKFPSTVATAFEVYTLIRAIGEGGNGQVFEARTSSGENRAIKILNQSGSQKHRRFKNEIGFCSADVHPNIIKVIDSGRTSSDESGMPFYVMPLFNGTLRNAAKGRTKDEKLRLLIQVLEGVEASHLHNVIHRDLKPENILWMQSEDRCVVADFGIASISEELLLTAVETKNQERLANFLYAAPEQRARGGNVDARADIFALGLMANELFTDAVPMGSGYRRIAQVDHSLAYLDPICDQMIAQDPGARPQSVSDVLRDLHSRGLQAAVAHHIDKLKREIVPASVPVNLVDAEDYFPRSIDVRLGELVLSLKQAPGSRLVTVFQEARYPHPTHSSGFRPAVINFAGNEAVLPLAMMDAQRAVDLFKQYMVEACKFHNVMLANEAHRAERDAQERRERAVREQVAREKIIREVKL